MQTILVYGRADAEDLPGRADWIVISIGDPDKPLATLQSGWAAVLQLAFHDKEDELLAKATGLWTLFDGDLARRCWTFIEEHRDKISGLLVHCTAGASRSPAVARAVGESFGLAPNADWPSGNSLVKRIMLETSPLVR